MKEVCPVCGSAAIVPTERFSKKYRCKACDEVFELTEKPAVKMIEKIIVEKPAEKKGLSPAEIYEKNIGSIIEITSYFSDMDARGTGFYISDNGYLLTNLHVVVAQDGAKAELCRECYGNGKSSDDDFELEVIYLDKDNDLALLKADVKSKALKLSDKLPAIGESVVAIGNVKGTGLSIVNGIIGDTERDFDGTPAFLFNALVAGGCSGGPIFNEKGEVCGVTVGERKDAEGMKFGIPVEVVRNFLKRAEREKRLKLLS